jgi:glycerol-3-phosphate acyltransferase PlsY
MLPTASPIWDALRDSGSNLGESLATLIMVMVAVIPWLVVFVLAIWLLRRLWKKRRGKIS